jgi:hypothetical protein
LEEGTPVPHTDQKMTLVFVINGENFSVGTNVNAPLLSAVEKALSDAGTSGRRDPGEWEVRDSNGVLLEMGRKVGDLGLSSGARLFITLKVGAGGGDRLAARGASLDS